MAKKTEAKATPKKKAPKKIEIPKHPLMLNGQSWDRKKVMTILCERIAASSKSIVTILAEDYEGHKLPDYSTIKEWLAADEDLSAQYARAKEDQAEHMAEEMLDIADDGSNDWMEKYGNDGEAIGYQLNGEHVQRSKLRLETRKWLMMKLKPKKYGEKMALEHSGKLGLEQLVAGESQ